MKVIGLAGWSGAGKTTLLTRIIPHFLAKGIRISVIKHAHHAFDVDVPGKDSWRHRESGATEVLVSSTRRWALMHELRRAGEPGFVGGRPGGGAGGRGGGARGSRGCRSCWRKWRGSTSSSSRVSSASRT